MVYGRRMAAVPGRRMSTIPTMLEVLAAQQNRGLSPEEEYLRGMSLSEEESQVTPMGRMASADMAGRPADVFAGTGSPAGRMLERRRMVERGIEPTEADMFPPSEVMSMPRTAPQSVRGRQTLGQEEQLIRLLISRGMSRQEATDRARSMGFMR